MKRFKIQAVIFTALRSKSVVRLLSEPNQIGSVIDQGKPPALPVDSQKFDICGSRHSGSVFEPESRVLKHAKTVRLLPLAIGTNWVMRDNFRKSAGFRLLIPAQKHCRDRRNDGGAVVISFADSVGSEQIPTAALSGPHFQASGFAGGI
jgi:hypothetical protein